MKNIFLTVFLLVCLAGSAQVKIGTDPSTVNANACLEIEFTDKGLLLPRVELTAAENAAPLSAHVQGMVVYNTATVNNVAPGIYSNNGTKWVPAKLSSTSAVTATCNGFAGTYTQGNGTRTYTITYTNNTFGAVDVTPLVTDLIITPGTGLTVNSVSPNTVTTIVPGDSLTVIYSLSGAITAPPGTTLKGDFTKLSLHCSATVIIE